MTVEVLGAVLGTAIQGQIVGMANAPCIPGPGDPVPNVTNVSTVDRHNNSLLVLPTEVNTCSSVGLHEYGVPCSKTDEGLACLTRMFVFSCRKQLT